MPSTFLARAITRFVGDPATGLIHDRLGYTSACDYDRLLNTGGGVTTPGDSFTELRGLGYVACSCCI